MSATIRQAVTTALLGVFWASAACPSPSPAATVEPRGEALFAELGCAACHTDLQFSTSLRERTPDLSSAGLRYNPAYLFEFLQDPGKVRRHLGRARMPGFYLSANEALALTAFLEAQREIPGPWPAIPAAIREAAKAPPQNISKEQFQAELARGLICLTCHTVDGKGGTVGLELTTIGYRLQRSWAMEYLVAPARFGVPAATMPAQFYQVDGDGRSFMEITPRAAERIHAVVDHLFSLRGEERTRLERPYLTAKAAFPQATAAAGEQLFRALNCAACHRHHSIPPRPSEAAPELSGEGTRVQREWLNIYLKHPVPLRPFGYRPGDGSRMPDFRLSDDDVAELSAFLGAPRAGKREAAPEFQPLSAFAQRKAKLLLTQKLSCLGCHRLGEFGGRIGPDLTLARARLQPDYVYGVIRNPRAVAPHSIMPRVSMTEESVRLIAAYLLQQPERPGPQRYLSMLDSRWIALEETKGTPTAQASIQRTYLEHCAACHGSEGRGDGFNAEFLPVRPTAHADAKSLSARPDDTLYDGIHAGGAILNKSHLMPPWGETLSSSEIRNLVGYLRTLCQCNGPAWSRDDAPLP
jgi:cytochrome c oxidase cbb3-type subunit 3